jgi:hypothetical protein
MARRVLAPDSVLFERGCTSGLRARALLWALLEADTEC